MQRPDDYLQQLADYVKRNLSKGYTVDSLKFSLMNQGYSRVAVENAIELANKQLASQAPLMKEKPQISYNLITEDKEITGIVEKKSFWQKLKSWFLGE